MGKTSIQKNISFGRKYFSRQTLEEACQTSGQGGLVYRTGELADSFDVFFSLVILTRTFNREPSSQRTRMKRRQISGLKYQDLQTELIDQGSRLMSLKLEESMESDRQRLVPNLSSAGFWSSYSSWIKSALPQKPLDANRHAGFSPSRER